MHHHCHVDSEIAHWLSVIHLERYQDTFKRYGFASVRDVISLSKEDLQKLGITATGHRKRILNLVQQTQQLVGNKSELMAGDIYNKSGRCTDALNRPKAEEKNDVDRNREIIAETVSGPGIRHDLADQNQNPPSNKKPTFQVAKPIPKPRTVFPHSHRTAKPEQAPWLKPQASGPAHKPTSLPKQTLGTFFTSEGFESSKSATNAESLGITTDSQPGMGNKVSSIILPAQCGERMNNSESDLKSFVSVKEMNSEVNSVDATSSYRSPTCCACQGQPVDTSPSESFCTISRVQREPLPLLPALNKSSSPEDRNGMVSDVAALLSVPTKSVDVKETPSHQSRTESSGLAVQNGIVTMEKEANSMRQLCQGLDHTPQGSNINSGPVEESISPYCESMFGQFWSSQGAASLECQEYEEVPECASSRKEESTNTRTEEKSPSAKKETTLNSCIAQKDNEGYSTVEAPWTQSSPFRLSDHLYPDEVLDDLTISPYASYTSLSERPSTVLIGWLDKLSPQGNYVFQRRFVRFDGKNIMYFNNEKEPYPKGMIPLTIIDMVRSTKDSKFQVVTKHRIFVFRAESEAQRDEWCNTLQQKVIEQRMLCSRPCLNGSNSRFQKFGYLELKGYKSKVFVVLILAEMWLYKSEQFFKMGVAICLIEMHSTTIREAKGRSFELITPFKIFSFVAESEREKREWMEALQNSIAETLYDYEVAEKIWSNKANRLCADCHAPSPDWASVNLCVVICKHCAGQHRSLGSSISKVQSLKLDTSIWSNEMVQLFIMLGNEQVNKFWETQLPPSEALYPDANAEQRQNFITCKYRYGRYCMPHPHYSSQEDILQALCSAVSGPGLLKTMLLFFATTMETEGGPCGNTVEAKPLCNNGQGQQRSSPGNLGVEELSPEGVYNEVTQPIAHSGYLYKAPAVTKLTVIKKSREEFQRVWCSLEKCFLFYETDKSSEPLAKIEMVDVISLGVNRTDVQANPGSSDRIHFTLELYLSNERVQQLEADGPDSLQSWASAIGKWFTPLSCHCLLGYEFQRVGKLCYKSMLNPNQWLQGFFILQKSHLFICPGEEGATEDSINLRQLQELSVVPLPEGAEKKEMLVLVEMGRTFCLQGTSRLDFSTWCMAIQASASGQGNALRDQQLSRSGIPIIVNSCIAFITQYGLQHEGIYRKNGAKSRIKLLMEDFRRDARNVKLRISDNFIEDVTDVLKRFFRELEDPVFTTYLHPQWKEAAGILQKSQRLEKYKELINHLPHLNRRTLAALIGHLYRVQKCADLNQMTTKNLALLFAPSLFQTDGKGEHEVKVMEDLIDNYVYIFNIDEDQVLQMDLENSLITTWRDVQLSQAGDIILEVYLEQKNPDCCVTLKVSPVMRAEELTNRVLEMRNVAASQDIWLTFEVLENGELERPLHPKEKVLEQALQWCKLSKPSSAYLLVKKVPIWEGSCLFTGIKRESPKCGLLKCREEWPKLLGNKFQERYFVIKDHKLLMLKEKRSVKPEREWLLDMAKVYMGIRKKLKPPSQWGFTLALEKQQLYLACTGQSQLWDWTTSILKAQHDNIRTVILRRRSSSDLAKQKFGTMPLIPLRGDSTNPTMLSANQTLHRLHTRRTLSMFFPMKIHQSSLEEQQETEESEPVYEEVGTFTDMGFLELRDSLLPPVDRTKKPVTAPEQSMSNSLPPCPAPRASGSDVGKAGCLQKTPSLELNKDSAANKPPAHGTTPSTSAEKEPGQLQGAPASEREQDQPNEVAALHPEPPTGMETQFGDTRRKSSQADLSIGNKLMQELSAAILRKNECQTLPVTAGKQNLPPEDGKVHLEGSYNLRTGSS
nr:PREDICTED: arf-GAP with Rho-GAP domain, ANK repeat and PH domain-containing protein 3 [Anolis carolinensis]XP_008107207.1 PREDICTED: arf-GAP with Rho-GAP domain, ANK repeat and PH domain-containing protein 3 [Anolis carolinensis]XP_016848526.1 PREDICTED: arf-GAP with Rho-GAP domain, ANK repeat and PH domain-containing protein 3 [Anolis carolinensis]|eukprot:XP_008107206.1 PREDICTED: arf-GAP with Rho-GAP domain, ANK repeat and PH domain-containing protein 3 [Anolis carolinensis]